MKEKIIQIWASGASSAWVGGYNISSVAQLEAAIEQAWDAASCMPEMWDAQCLEIYCGGEFCGRNWHLAAVAKKLGLR